MASVRPVRCGDLLSVLKQTNIITLAEAERKAFCAAVILIDHQKSVCRASSSREYMHDRFWTGRITEHIAVGPSLCYTQSIISKEGTYEENYLSYFGLDSDAAVRLRQRRQRH